MLYAIIGCVLLLIIAIVLKKQGEKSKGTKADTKKTTAKKTAAKKTSITEAESVLQSTAQVAEVSISDDVRRQIENLIRSQDYSTAEALINKNLNQNAAQHGLYLFLLDIHLAQKDEFAVSQLLNHVKSLGLEQIAQQVEEKQQIAKAEAAAKRETLEFNAPVIERPKPATTTANANFDALVESTPKNTSSFDELQSSFTPSTATKAEPESVDHTPLDFSFTPSTPPAQEPPKAEEAPALDFAFNNTSAEPIKEAPSLDFALDQLDTAKNEQKVETPAILDFSLDVAPQTTTPPSPTLDFAFETKTDHTSTTSNELDFALDVAPTPLSTPKSAVEDITEFKFDLDAPQLDRKKDIAESVPSFNFDTDVKTEAPVETVPNFNFDTDVKTEAPAETVPSFKFDADVKTESPTETVPSFSFDLSEPTPVQTTDITSTEPEQPVVSLPISDVAAFVETPVQNTTVDPVVQAFPDLLKINEAELNLDLAQHYIQLGAYASARQLLSENDHLFSLEQRELSEKLLNQIAS